MMPDEDRLTAMLTRLKLTAIRDGLDSLLDEASRGELTLRESLALLCVREIARKDSRRIEMAIGLARFPTPATSPGSTSRPSRRSTAGRSATWPAGGSWATARR